MLHSFENAKLANASLNIPLYNFTFVEEKF